MCHIVCLWNLWHCLSTRKLICCKNIAGCGIFVTYILAWSHILCWIYNLILTFIRWHNRKFYDGSGLTESLFSNHKDEYPEYERASLRQLYQVKVLIVSIFFFFFFYCANWIWLQNAICDIMQCRWKSYELKASKHLIYLGPLDAQKQLP